jgi:hypothetical protein
MFWHQYLPTVLCLLLSGQCCAVGAADDPAAGQIIGLCHRGGLGGIVLEETLKTEGIPYARLDDLDQLERSGLRGLVLDECPDGAAPKIAKFLDGGGILLTLKPAGPLAQALGLEQVGAQKAGHLVVGGKAAAMISYTGRLQLSGTSNGYRGGENLVRLDGKEAFGGITRVKRGTGTALVVSFDLPKTLLALLQPESECGKIMDAANVEYELIDVPQVDLMRRLLVGLFLESLDVPVVRKWYFPSQHPAMLAVLGDQDAANFEQMKVVLGMMKELGAPYTLFVTPWKQPITREQFRTLTAGGMELAFHPDLTAPGKFTQQEFDAQWKKAVADVGGPMTGERTHCSRWQSFRETPTWAERAGLQYDAILGVRSWPSKLPKNGYVLGTGLPYRFIDPDGPRRTDFLEIPTTGIDNQDFWKRRQYLVSYKPEARRTFLVGLSLTEDEAFEVWKPILARAADTYHLALGYCWHPHYLAARTLGQTAQFEPTDVHFRKCIAYAKSRGIGLTGVNAWNDFWRAREKVAFEDVVWHPASATAEYTISSKTKIGALTLLTPLRFHGKTATVHIDGRPKSYTQMDLFGDRQATWTTDLGPQEKLRITVKYD